MLPAQYRISPYLIGQTMRIGRRWEGTAVRIYSTNNTLEHNRFTIIVPKKVAKHAVTRNRLKRILHEACTKYLVQKNKFQDLVIMVKNKETLISTVAAIETLAQFFAKEK